MADYNINAVTRRVVFTGSAGVGPYAFSFEVLDQNDVAVYFNTTKLTLTTDYTVTVNANGTGSVTIVTGTNVPSTPTASDTIIIIGARDIERVTDFVTAGDLLASSLNEQLDALTIFDQQIAEEGKRSMRAPVYDPALVEDGGTLDMTLPPKADRVDSVMAFDTNGNPVKGPTVSGVTTITGLAADIATLADIEDGTVATDAISDTAAIASNVTTVAGIAPNVTTVAGISSDVTAVAADATDIGTVATNIANVNAVGAIDSDVTTVAGIAANVTTTAGISSDVTAVAGVSADVTTVAGVSANVTTVAGISADVTTVAGDSAAIQAVAADATDIGTVATNIADVTTVATDIANVNTTASNIAGVNSFAERYRVAAADPTTSLDAGDLAFNTTDSALKYYNGTSWASITAGLTDIVGDVTPQLGGNLDLNSNDITGTGNVNITGNITSSGDLTVDTNTLYVDSTNNRVGIGTSSPSAGVQLDVQGTGVLQLVNTDTVQLLASGSGSTLKNVSNNPLLFGTNNTERMRITAGGNVGIGDSSPSAKLDVYSSSGSTTDIGRFEAAVGGYTGTSLIAANTIGADSAYNLFKCITDSDGDAGGPYTQFVVRGDGNVGIGETSPADKIHSSGDIRLTTGASTTRRMYALSGASAYSLGSSGGAAIVFQRDGSNNDEIAFETHANGVSHNERMRITAAGAVGIGTGSPSGGVQLDVRGSGVIQLINSDNIQLIASGGGSILKNVSNNPLLFGTNNSERMRIDSSGNLLVGYSSSNGAYKLQVNSQIFATSATIATSDGNYKENVTPLNGVLSLVSQLNPVQFDWKEHPVHEFDRNQPTIGFIAQEVQQVLAEQPYLNSIVKSNECVLEPEEKDDEGNVIKEAVTEPFLGIAEVNMVALLTAAIKEQQSTITALEARIAALEAK